MRSHSLTSHLRLTYLLRSNQCISELNDAAYNTFAEIQRVQLKPHTLIILAHQPRLVWPMNNRISPCEPFGNRTLQKVGNLSNFSHDAIKMKRIA